MSIETWLAFAAASAILVVIPGPTVLLVVSYALGQGWRAALPVAIGVALGDFTAMTLSMLGVGALLAASATVFTLLKWLGAAYLVWLGIKLWRAGGALEAEPRRAAASEAKMLGHAWLVTALNPKGLTFFIAFLPQFLDPHADFASQMIVFEATFLFLAFANAFGYALVAPPGRESARARHRQPNWRHVPDRRRHRRNLASRVALARSQVSLLRGFAGFAAPRCATKLPLTNVGGPMSEHSSEQPASAAPDANSVSAERRRVPRLKTLLSGILVFDDTGTTMDCTVRNISAYGARIVLADIFRMPEVFNLKVPHHDQTHRATIVWRKGEMAGLELSDVGAAAQRGRRRMTPRELKRAHQKELAAAEF